jgi:hypothetical protein
MLPFKGFGYQELCRVMALVCEIGVGSWRSREEGHFDIPAFARLADVPLILPGAPMTATADGRPPGHSTPTHAATLTTWKASGRGTSPAGTPGAVQGARRRW